MAKTDTITQAELQALYHYCPESGHFTAKTSNNRRFPVGRIAGTDHQGYIRIFVNGRYALAHRLAFLYMEGDMPEAVDHINRVRSDNRWSNLRRSNWQLNAYNRSASSANTSGLPGVHWCRHKEKWIVQLYKDGKRCNHSHYCLLDAAAERISHNNTIRL